ncbi:Brix-domain-containing protein [Laetiporus sulphureus 93-53]|uniref:Brix-domain-containing protein n=1 Tax=Laetiporus sulphureus 93-53 TaxID=1314785 RepID=A0A165E3C1_9APHY|nr:Brix-domain-containing protein [Laetiporus sulphureus 93-53]KZT06164.1 Brix-domain-containing protein [Laetiporus sulphureus 93-53]
MPANRFEPSSIKNKVKREEVARRHKKQKRQDKLQRRLALAKAEANDPVAKKRRREQNVPRTLDNTREFDPSILTADPSASTSAAIQPEASTSSVPAEHGQAHPPEQQPQDESAADLANDPFAAYFSGAADPSVPPKVLITTSPKATRVTYDFCNELVNVFPGAEFIRRKKGKGFEMGRIAGWAANREYSHLMVVNEDMKKPNAITVVYLPEGPTAYFKLTSIEMPKKIHGHARPTDHFPELVLNGFVTRLGHTVGRLFQTLFPPMPEFQGRQVVTLHNQRDFLFFRRHRYAFRSTEKVALQEIGPRFTLKLRSLRKGLPAVKNLGEPSKPLEFDTFQEESTSAEDVHMADVEGTAEAQAQEGSDSQDGQPSQQQKNPKKVLPPTEDEYQWIWKPELETTRRTFFL